MTKDQAYNLLARHYKEFDEYNGDMAGQNGIDVRKSVQALNKHDQVKKAYVSTSGNLIVLTKRLYPVDPANHRRYPQIGRFTIRIQYGENFDEEDGISVANQDYHTKSNNSDFDGFFEHPHVTTESRPNMCFGDNGDIAEQAYANGDIYELVDFILLSLTTWNQDDGNPYLDYDAFYRLRVSRKSRMFIEKEAL